MSPGWVPRPGHQAGRVVYARVDPLLRLGITPHEVVKHRVIFLDDGRQTVRERGHHAGLWPYEPAVHGGNLGPGMPRLDALARTELKG
jgi:hypothetical protein